MRLNDIADNPGAVKKRVRVGRGPGSAKAKLVAVELRVRNLDLGSL